MRVGAEVCTVIQKRQATWQQLNAARRAGACEGGSIAASGPAASMRDILAIVAAWFVCSVVTEVYDKLVMTTLGVPLTLALWKFAAAVPLGVVAVLVAGQPLCAISLHGVLCKVMPLASLIVLAKLLTYISYGHVPLSTAQIVKAATPVMSVVMTRNILGERFGIRSYASLIPIAVGVCLAVGIDAEFSPLGVVAALASCAFAAAQGIYMKTLFLGADAKASALKPLTPNLPCAGCCAALLLPLWVGVQMGYLPAKLDGGRVVLNGAHAFKITEWSSLSILGGTNGASAASDASSTSTSGARLWAAS